MQELLKATMLSSLALVVPQAALVQGLHHLAAMPALRDLRLGEQV